MARLRLTRTRASSTPQRLGDLGFRFGHERIDLCNLNRIMPRCFFGNLDFEHELAAPLGWQAPARVQRVLAEQASAWIALADDGDVVWTPEPVADDFWEQLSRLGLPRVRGTINLANEPTAAAQLVPWGWSRTACGIGSQTPKPDENCVRLGNSREWSFALEQEFGVSLPGAVRLDRVDDFTHAVLRAAGELHQSVSELAWVIKANFGMAARERILGRGSQLTESQAAWLRYRLANDGAVFFEPWLSIRQETGVQIRVPRASAPFLEGITPLWTDAQGQYRGSQFSLASDVPAEWQPAVDVALQAAERLQRSGYFGPFGVDAAIYRTPSGDELLRPLQDINARFTMGRLALGFRRLLRDNEVGAWCHGLRYPVDRAALSSDWRAITLTPPRVGTQSVQQGSMLFIAPRESLLMPAVRALT